MIFTVTCEVLASVESQTFSRTIFLLMPGRKNYAYSSAVSNLLAAADSLPTKAAKIPLLL